jgi:hypothetical protein
MRAIDWVGGLLASWVDGPSTGAASGLLRALDTRLLAVIRCTDPSAPSRTLVGRVFLDSMGRAPPTSTNALVVSLWSTMQRELLGRHTRASTELAVAVFE